MYLAIDIGGTKTLLAVFSAAGKLVESKRFETPLDYDGFLAEMKKTYESLEHSGKFTACAVGAPGKVDRKAGVVVAFGNLAWENIPLAKDLEKIIGLKPLIENDANLAGLSEAILISHEYKKALYITISTGIGGVLVVNKVIDPDTADMEFGHMIFEHDGKLMKWQEFGSGKAIFNKYGMRASDIPAEDHQTWYKVARNIALGLTNVISTLTPDVVIIGGGVGTHFDKFIDPLHEELMTFGSTVVSLPPLRQAIRSEEAVIYGCYELAHQSKR